MLSNANAKSKPNSKSIEDKVYYYSYNINPRLYEIKRTKTIYLFSQSNQSLYNIS